MEHTYRISYVDNYIDPKYVMYNDYKAKSESEAIRKWQSECLGCKKVSIHKIK